MQSSAGEYVLIRGPTPNVQKLFAIDSGINVPNRYTNSLTADPSLWRNSKRDWASLLWRYVCIPLIRKIKIVIDFCVSHADIYMVSHISCWGVPGIGPNWCENPLNYVLGFKIATSRGLIADRNESALTRDQSAFSDFSGILSGICGFMRSLVGTVKKNALNGTYYDQQKSENGQKAIGDFQPRPPKNMEGPVFASLISAFIGILVSLPLGIVGGVLLLDGRRLVGGVCVVVALCLAFCSTVGLLIGMDLWSLWRRFQ